MFMVMSAVELTSANSNRERCFEFNAVDIPSLEEAQKVAASRNAKERAAGHDNVTWFCAPQF